MDNQNSKDRIRPYLGTDEYVIWTGKPEKGHLLEKSDIFTIPFSVVWCSFAFFWTFGTRDFFPFLIPGLLFVSAGLYLVFGRFIHKAVINKNTFYAITDKKIIRKVGSKVDMLDRGSLPMISVKMNRDGTGTVSFGDESPAPDRFARRSGYSIYPGAGPLQLSNIADPMRVQRILNGEA